MAEQGTNFKDRAARRAIRRLATRVSELERKLRSVEDDALDARSVAGEAKALADDALEGETEQTGKRDA